jgi:hypothetical protein
LAGCCGYVSVSAETVSGLKAILGGLSLGRGIPFPRCRLILDEAGPNVVAKPAIGALLRLRFGLRGDLSGSDCDDRRFPYLSGIATESYCCREDDFDQ